VGSGEWGVGSGEWRVRSREWAVTGVLTGNYMIINKSGEDTGFSNFGLLPVSSPVTI